MAVLGIDDTDSATSGMCTTYIGTLVAERLAPASTTTFLVRLNPSIEHKTRGNGAVGIRTSASVDEAFEAACEVVDAHARMSDPETNPGVASVASDAVPLDLSRFAIDAIRSRCHIDQAATHLQDADASARGWGNRRGLIGAAAAVGAVRAFDDPSDGCAGVFGDWTAEYLAYREPSRWGSTRDIDADSIRTATAGISPRVWDNVDPVTGEPACVPRTPCPVLFGIRGEDPNTVARVGRAIDGEPHPRGRVFISNQGTDAHLRSATLSRLRAGRAYRVAGTVVDEPTDRRGGHVRFALGDGDATIDCLAFEPTKRFRTHVRRLRPGDGLVACGEFDRGSLKLEKFALVDPVCTELVPPTCPACGGRMKSAGRGQGYRCRDCRTQAPTKVPRPLERDIDPGWYEVPVAARRHLAKPLIRTDRAPAQIGPRA